MAIQTRTRPEPFIISVRKALFEVSPLSTKEKDKLFKDYTKMKWERGQRFEDFQSQAASCELFVATVKNWGQELADEGDKNNWDVMDEDNNPIPCTQETKRNFYQRNITLANEIIEKAEEATVSMTETAAKNWSAGEDGISPQDA